MNPRYFAIFIWVFLFALGTALGLAWTSETKTRSNTTAKVELWSGGSKVGQWMTDGNVSVSSSGYRFVDAKTGETVTVNGTLVITFSSSSGK